MSDPLHRYLDDFGRRLEEATARSSPPRPSAPAALAAAAAFAVVVGIVLLLVVAPGGGSRLDVVAKARAALVDRGRLVHLTARGYLRPPGHPGGNIGPSRLQAFRMEQWSTGSPPRWRIASTVGGYTFQLAFGKGSFSRYDERRNTVEIRHGPSAKFVSWIPLPTRVLFGARDPIATIRGMLRRDELHDGGWASVGGQTVRRLVGERPIWAKLPRRLAHVRYYVDPHTYAPVAADIALPPPRLSPHAPTLRVHIRFTSFERLPLTAHNEHLLEIQTSGKPRITRANGAQAVVVPLKPK